MFKNYAPIFSDEDEEEFVTHYLWLIVDRSGSMNAMREQVYHQIHSIFSGLTAVNEASTDLRNTVKLMLFNGSHEEFNSCHLLPGQLGDVFTEDDYQCSGATSASVVSRYIDSELHSSSPVVQKLQKNTPKFTFIIVTDAKVNDPSGIRAEARRILESNRYYQKYCRVLVVFLGDEEDKATAVAMADGHEENVVALSDDLTELLSPVIIGSTVTFTDGTHMNTGSRTVSQLTREAKERTLDGSTGAADLSDEELHKKLLSLMGKAAG